MSAREFVKIILAKEAISLKELSRLASEKSNKKYTPYGLCHKMRLGTLRYEEAELFAKILGYKIELRKIKEL